MLKGGEGREVRGRTVWSHGGEEGVRNRADNEQEDDECVYKGGDEGW